MIEAQPDTGDSAPPRNKARRPKSKTIALTRRARDRFDRKVAENIDALFEALFEAATEDGDVNAARLLIDRAIPSRRGAPVSFSLRPLRSPPDCADALDDLLVAVSEGRLTPDEANIVSAIVRRTPAVIYARRLLMRARVPSSSLPMRVEKLVNLPFLFLAGCRAARPSYLVRSGTARSVETR